MTFPISAAYPLTSVASSNRPEQTLQFTLTPMASRLVPVSARPGRATLSVAPATEVRSTAGSPTVLHGSPPVTLPLNVHCVEYALIPKLELPIDSIPANAADSQKTSLVSYPRGDPGGKPRSVTKVPMLPSCSQSSQSCRRHTRSKYVAAT